MEVVSVAAAAGAETTAEIVLDFAADAPAAVVLHGVAVVRCAVQAHQ